MSRLAALVHFAVSEFGPLAAFLVLASTLGVKPAILVSIALFLLDGAWRWRRGAPFTRLYLLTSGLTLVFGAIDLVSAAPFMLKYEAPLTNVATAAAFVIGAMGEKPMLQEVAEQRQAEPFRRRRRSDASSKYSRSSGPSISSPRRRSTSGLRSRCRCPKPSPCVR